MGFFIIIVGILQVIGGLLAYAAAGSAIHQILGAISFGMGILSVALAVVIVRLTEIRDKLR